MVSTDSTRPPTVEEWLSLVEQCPEFRRNPYAPEGRTAMAQTLANYGFLYEGRTLISGKIVPILGNDYFPLDLPTLSIFDPLAAGIGITVTPVAPQPETTGWLPASIGLDRVPALDPKPRWKRDHFVASIPNGRCVFSPWGYAIFAETGHYITDFCCNDGRLIPWSGIAPGGKHIDGTVALLPHSWGHAVFHWNLETLPRFELFRLAGIGPEEIDHFAVRIIEPWHLEYLDLLGIPHHKLVAYDQIANFDADRLLLCSNVEQGDWASYPNVHEAEPWVSQLLTNLVPDPDPSAVPTERIYISRGKAPSRQMYNETDLRTFLERNGFRTVFFEEMNLAEKAACMRNAAVVLSPIGAALSYIPFMRPGSKCVALYNDDACGETFRDICANVGVIHYHVLNPSTARFFPNQTIPITEHHREQITDIRRLAELLTMAEITLDFCPNFNVVR